ncbi:MAG: chemotaxis-specific protein-glutamate methyltransferase CheB, partial [Myxococcales bacterium]|nr:chemotaxis-specific protein-glutamate methyltransferase CheB [Myxococcales bacterium]
MIRVLVVDDSPILRRVLSEALREAPDIEVVATAINGKFGVAKAKSLKPDVITMDVEMPQMNGLEALEAIMSEAPTPVVMVSSLTTRGAVKTIEALERGAVDYVAKPTGDPRRVASISEELIAKVRAAAGARVRRRPLGGHAEPDACRAAEAPASPSEGRKREFSGEVDLIAIGASTGGVTALHEMFASLPDSLPPIVITQHMPPTFTKSFADRLNDVSRPAVCEARDDMLLEAGHAYVAPGDRHMTVVGHAGHLRVRLNDGEKVSGHRPSVDALFNSIDTRLAPRTLGVILTGMGADGAKG